jgi:hypothetical protein
MGSSSTCEPARTSNDRSTGTRAARNMPPVISTIVMSRLFARRERTSMSAYFTNSLTPLAYLASLRGKASPGRAARGSVSRKMACRPAAGEHGFSSVQGHQRAHRGGQPRRCPFLIGSRNGRQDAPPCFARRPVALLRRHCLDYGSRCFRLGLFCARRSWDIRRSREVLALTFTKSPSPYKDPQ